MKPRMQWVAVAVSAAVLAACGGGGADTTPATAVTAVKVMGDSLADSGSFGLKFTVQGTAPTGAGSTAIWPERVAASYGRTLCPHYVSAGGSFSAKADCTNYAVGGGRINNFKAPTSPVSILQELPQDHGPLVQRPEHRHAAEPQRGGGGGGLPVLRAPQAPREGARRGVREVPQVFVSEA